MNPDSRKDTVFMILAGFFITNAIMAEMIGGKIVNFDFMGLSFIQSIGILPWPVVFLTTDLINEYYGRKGVVRLSLITVGLILYAFLLLFIAIDIPAIKGSSVSFESFKQVFGTSQWIIAGSVIAFLVAQLVDAFSFSKIKGLTGNKMIWLRATASTAISQLMDTFIVQFVAFVIPGAWTAEEWMERASWGYLFKLMVALGLIPVIYLVHGVIDKYLQKER
ncbi:MAG: queuosine precursor transporter [Bacteroidia bacterium]|nr:queuosine precursor transporter [Bacteroidia bacterium]